MLLTISIILVSSAQFADEIIGANYCFITTGKTVVIQDPTRLSPSQVRVTVTSCHDFIFSDGLTNLNCTALNQPGSVAVGLRLRLHGVIAGPAGPAGGQAAAAGENRVNLKRI